MSQDTGNTWKTVILELVKCPEEFTGRLKAWQFYIINNIIALGQLLTAVLDIFVLLSLLSW